MSRNFLANVTTLRVITSVRAVVQVTEGLHILKVAVLCPPKLTL